MARQVFIPALGTSLTLVKDWTFTIVNESRNRSLAEHLGIKPEGDRWVAHYPFGSNPDDFWEPKTPNPATFTISKGNTLVVDRIYIRQGAVDFDSVTFRCKLIGSKKSLRFFAKLADVNTMVVK